MTPFIYTFIFTIGIYGTQMRMKEMYNSIINKIVYGIKVQPCETNDLELDKWFNITIASSVNIVIVTGD